MRLASHPHWLIHVQIIKDCNLIFTCFQCWSSSCFLSSSCLHFCNFTLHLQIATFLQLHSLDLQSVSLEDSLHLHSSCLHFCNFTHLMLLSSYSSICFTWGFTGLDVTWSFTHFLFKSFHQHLFNPFHSLDLRSSSLSNLQVFCLNLNTSIYCTWSSTHFDPRPQLSSLQIFNTSICCTWSSTHFDLLSPRSIHPHINQPSTLQSDFDEIHRLWGDRYSSRVNLFASHATVAPHTYAFMSIKSISNRAPSCALRLLRISSSRSDIKCSQYFWLAFRNAFVFSCVRLDVFPLRPSWRLSASVHVPRFRCRLFPIATETSATKLNHTGSCLASPRLTVTLQQLRQTCIYYRCCHYSKSTSASMIVLN